MVFSILFFFPFQLFAHVDSQYLCPIPFWKPVEKATTKVEGNNSSSTKFSWVVLVSVSRATTARVELVSITEVLVLKKKQPRRRGERRGGRDWRDLHQFHLLPHPHLQYHSQDQEEDSSIILIQLLLIFMIQFNT